MQKGEQVLNPEPSGVGDATQALAGWRGQVWLNLWSLLELVWGTQELTAGLLIRMSKEHHTAWEYNLDRELLFFVPLAFPLAALIHFVLSA